MKPLPEQYWIDLEKNVIGQDVLRDGVNARQAATYQAIVKWLMQHHVTNILDVGCNVCALAMFLRFAKYEGDYLGVDSNPYSIFFAQTGRWQEVIETDNLRALHQADRSFEAVVVKDVIEHLEGPELLAEAFRVSSKYVVVATYLPWSMAPAEIKQHPDGYYTNRYSWRDVIPLTKRWGFDLAAVMDLEESNGTRNQVSCWERV